jgi:hypothetical protein
MYAQNHYIDGFRTPHLKPVMNIGISCSMRIKLVDCKTAETIVIQIADPLTLSYSLTEIRNISPWV